MRPGSLAGRQRDICPAGAHLQECPCSPGQGRGLEARGGLAPPRGDQSLTPGAFTGRAEWVSSGAGGSSLHTGLAPE